MFLTGSASIAGSRSRSSRARTQSVEVICLVSKSRIFTCLPETAASRAISWQSVDFPTPPFCDTTPTTCRFAVAFPIPANFAGNSIQCKAAARRAPVSLRSRRRASQAQTGRDAQALSAVEEGRMQFGFNLPNSGALATPEIMGRIAREGEALGYDY